MKFSKRNRILLVLLMSLVFLRLVMAIFILCLYLAERMPTLQTGGCGGVIAEEDRHGVLGTYVDLVERYSERNSDPGAIIPHALDEIVISTHDDIVYVYLYYPFNSDHLVYHLTDGSEVEYRDGWLILPDYQFYALNIYGEKDRLALPVAGYDDNRTRVGVFFTFSYTPHKDAAFDVLSAEPEWSLQLAKHLRLFILKHDIAADDVFTFCDIMFYLQYVLLGIQTLILGYFIIKGILGFKRRGLT